MSQFPGVTFAKNTLQHFVIFVGMWTGHRLIISWCPAAMTHPSLAIIWCWEPRQHNLNVPSVSDGDRDSTHIVCTCHGTDNFHAAIRLWTVYCLHAKCMLPHWCVKVFIFNVLKSYVSPFLKSYFELSCTTIKFVIRCFHVFWPDSFCHSHRVPDFPLTLKSYKQVKFPD